MRMQNLIIDGSPRWEIYRTVPVSTADIPAAAATSFESSGAQAAETSAPGRPRSGSVRISSAEPSVAAGGLVYNPASGKFEVLRCLQLALLLV